MDVITSSFQEILISFPSFRSAFLAAIAIFIISLYGAGLLSKAVQSAMRRCNISAEIIILVEKNSGWKAVILGTFAALLYQWKRDVLRQTAVRYLVAR